MLYGEVQRQRLKIVRDFVVADTIDYLEMQFSFSEDWDGLSKWAHFSAMGKVYDIPLTDNTIRKEDHLNLSAGIWAVYLHGNEFADGVVVERITTNAVMMRVEPTGVLNGEPFAEVPASEVERILARLDALEKGGGGGGITEEKDPTVPDWAKQKEKPNYTAEEVGALPAGTRIPARVSELQNDSGFITRTVADLVNYYRKTEVYARDETYSRAETDSVIAGLEKRLNGIADSDDVTLDQLSEIVAYIKNNKTLIESVTTAKVSVDDIVNNLKTPDAKKPLSAAQGVVLNDADISDVVFGKWDYSSDGTSYYMRVVLKSGGEILRTLPTHNPEDWITSADRAPYPSNGQFDTDWRRYGSWWVDETRGVLYLSQNGNVPGAGLVEPGMQKWLEIRGGLPEHTAADEGKSLRIINNAAAWTDGDVRYIASQTLRVGDNVLTDEMVTLGAGWSGNLADGFTHTSGSTEPLTFSVGAADGESYIIEADYTTNVAEKAIVFSLGDSYETDPYNGKSHLVWGLTCVGKDGALKITPASNYSGKIANLTFRKVTEDGKNELEIELGDIQHTDMPKHLSGFWNIAMGEGALESSVNGTRNIAIGYSSEHVLKAGGRNIGIGTFSMSQMESGERNISIGADSMFRAKRAVKCVAIGPTALDNGDDVSDCVAIGEHALAGLKNSTNAATVTTKRTVAIGSAAGYYNRNSYNVFIGNNAGYGSSTISPGIRNVYIGDSAGKLSSGQDCVVIGQSAEAGSYSNAVVFGQGATATKANQVVLGNDKTTETLAKGNLVVRGTDGVKRQIVFNADGTCGWTEVS